MNKFFLLPCSLCVFSCCLLPGWADDAPLDIGSRRELFVDEYLAESLDNVRQVLNTPEHESAALLFDRPWEGRYCGYVTVLKDGDLYRMYYRGLPESGKDGSNNEVTCCAESKDGILWTRPELSLFTVRDQAVNNIVLADQAPYSHNFAPFLNSRPDASPDKRYLAMAGTSETGLSTFASPDGLHWRMLNPGVIRDGAFDSQNIAFWSEAEACYVCYFRTWSEGSFGGYRWISRSTSADFITWSVPEVMSAGTTPPEHMYTNQTVPYYRAPHIYISLAARFMPERRVVSEEDARRLGIEGDYFKDCSDNVLMTSRGGNSYDRTFMEGFIKPGIGLENWTSRTNYPAWGIVPIGETEMSFYIQHNYGQPTARVDRYSMRPDGFVSMRANYDGGTFATKPLLFSGTSLYLNFSTSAAGSIRVALLRADGTPFDGYGEDKCEEIIGNMLDRPVKWEAGSDISSLAGTPLRLRFHMKDADLYAIQFR
ncbi:MAG: hypothetical protein BWX80_02365 [Candidatus Hydrogenedentes bacterium ADurb.Bin101]|nr:MAG: hypothetical protein BWX80_02365 [Candidatus Hydrogenedentes bacterium ADurb.Bin101]